MSLPTRPSSGKNQSPESSLANGISGDDVGVVGR